MKQFTTSKLSCKNLNELDNHHQVFKKAVNQITAFYYFIFLLMFS